jgi:hypothetical protein
MNANEATARNVFLLRIVFSPDGARLPQFRSRDADQMLRPARVVQAGGKLPGLEGAAAGAAPRRGSANESHLRPQQP